MNTNLISQDALREAAKTMHKHLGDLDDLPIELVNTLANIYYRYFAYTEHMLSGGKSLYLDPYVPQSSSVIEAYKNLNKFHAEALPAFQYAKELIKSARQVRAERPESFPYFVTLTLDMLKYNIDNTSSKNPIRRAIERKFKKVYEIPNLVELMRKAGLHDDALYRQARVVFDRYGIRNWNATDNPATFSAFSIFQRLADEDYGKAYYPLSILYKEIKRDIKEDQHLAQHYAQMAFDWCVANQAHQDTELWFDLGRMYLDGHGVEQNDERAAYWFRMAAEQGHAEAQYYFAIMYDIRKDAPRNYKEAAKWYRLAAEQGNNDAQRTLGNRYRDGKGVEQDNEQAGYWFRMAAEQGYVSAQFDLGDMYAWGKGVPQDIEEAMKWYRLAADKGYTPAQVALGHIYINGSDEQYDEQAEYWFRMAAEQGNAEGQRYLALMNAR